VIAKINDCPATLAFLLGLERAGVDFVAADIPGANRLTVGIMAMVADEERRMIAARTKAALAARSVRRGAAANKEKAVAFAATLAPAMNEMQERGLWLRQMAAELTTRALRQREVAHGQPPQSAQSCNASHNASAPSCERDRQSP
jgi:hypothetical protein